MGEGVGSLIDVAPIVVAPTVTASTKHFIVVNAGASSCGRAWAGSGRFRRLIREERDPCDMFIL